MRRRWRTATAFLALVGCSALAGALINSKLAVRPRPVLMVRPVAAWPQGRPEPKAAIRRAPRVVAGSTAEDLDSSLVMQSPRTDGPALPTVDVSTMILSRSDQPGKLAPPAAKADPVEAVETFVKANRDQAEATIRDLNAEADQLRARLARVEDALARWQALAEALKAGSTGMPPPEIELAPISDPGQAPPWRNPARASKSARPRVLAPPPAEDDERPARVRSQPRPSVVAPPPAAPEDEPPPMPVPAPDSTPTALPPATTPDPVALPDPGPPRG